MRHAPTLDPSLSTLLMAAHSRVRALLAGVDAPGPEETPDRSGQIDRIRRELDILLELEKSLLHPALLKAGMARDDHRGVLTREKEEMLRRLRAGQKQSAPGRRETGTFYPTLQDRHGDLEEDRDASSTFRSPAEANSRQPSDFESWGSE